MLKAYAITGDTLVVHTVAVGQAFPDNTIWVDMIEPTAEEDRQVEAFAGVAIPTRDEMSEIEESSRFYAENDALYLTAPVLHASDTGFPGIEPVTFVVTKERVVSVRYTQPKPFELYAQRTAKPGNGLVFEKCDRLAILFGLIETITDRLADILENVARHLDAESTRLISASTKKPMTTADFRSGLKLIGKEGDSLSKVRESLAGISRLLLYVQVNGFNDKTKAQKKAWLKSLDRDVDSLIAHTSYLSDRTTFLLDTVVGLVSVEQNAIIKIFSVAAVVFMPPTLVASIYGMNFTHMPELGWLLGYPWAIALMATSAVLPLAYFKAKHWL